MKMIPCACGCGELIPEFAKNGDKRKYVHGHQNKDKKHINNVNMIECACGCGTLIPEFDKRGRKRKYIRGHHIRSKDYHEKMKHNMIPCACGCGILIPEFDKYGNKRKYIMNHHFKGKTFSDEHKKKIIEGRKGYKHSEETKKKIGDVHRGKIVSKETRKKISERQRGEKNWNCGGRHSEETKLKISEANKGEKNHFYGKKHSEETKLKMSEAHKGEKSHLWKGGIASLPYCHKFNNTYKEKIREYYGRKCFLCDKSEEDNDMKLPVHHVDYNKECGCDDNMCKCVPLCASCHSKTNGNREMWENKIMLLLKSNDNIKIDTTLYAQLLI